MRLTRTCIVLSVMAPALASATSQLISKIGTQLRAHEGRTDIDPGLLGWQPQRHRAYHQHIRLAHAPGPGAVIAIGPERFEQQPAGHRNAGIAGAEVLPGAIENRRHAALAGTVLYPQPRQSRKPCGLLRLVIELKTVLRVVFGPIACIRHGDGMLDQRIATGMPALASIMSLREDLPRLGRQRL